MPIHMNTQRMTIPDPYENNFIFSLIWVIQNFVILTDIFTMCVK